jgi:hypothetical protein
MGQQWWNVACTLNGSGFREGTRFTSPPFVQAKTAIQQLLAIMVPIMTPAPQNLRTLNSLLEP